VEKIESIPSDISNDNFDEYIVKDAIFYRIQVAIEGVTDIAAMLVRDIGKDVGMIITTWRF